MEASSGLPSKTTMKIRGANPRRNLPASVSRKRGESNFQRAFERAYLEKKSPSGVIWQDFALAGYGVADLIWISWENSESTSALSLEQLQHSLRENRLTAFEMKIANWRSGLMQTYRYRYFADRAILVLPPNEATRAQKALHLFMEMDIGLWSFDVKDLLISKLFTPNSIKAKSPLAREKAINAILANSKLRKALK